MESIGLLAGGIAHDFNNILTVILGNTSILKMSMAESGVHQPEIDEIEVVATRAAEMTRQLLSFSRKHGGSPRRIDLSAVVVGMQTMLGRLLPETIRSEYCLRDGELPVFADPGQVEQVLLNLVVNARDAIPDNGVITIETFVGRPHASSAEVFFDSFAHPGRDMAVIAVSDNGVGIEPAHLHRVFEPFFTTKEVGKGTGLGLSTVFGIVKQQEGTLSVQSEPGHGSTFRVYLPLTERGEEAPDAASPEPARGGTETLLVVEDDPGVRQVAIRMLEDLGYTVIPAEDGASAIAIARAHPERIDLLLTDIIMPGIPGPDVARELRRIRPDLPVVYASGYPADYLARSGLSPDEFTLVHKPFSRVELATAVQAALRQRRLRDA
jgi:CheY-like chemotaxis protein